MAEVVVVTIAKTYLPFFPVSKTFLNPPSGRIFFGDSGIMKYPLSPKKDLMMALRVAINDPARSKLILLPGRYHVGLYLILKG